MSGSLMVMIGVVSVLARQVASLFHFPFSILQLSFTIARLVWFRRWQMLNIKWKMENGMSDRTFSLFHQAAPPKGGLESKPPLLLMLHGYGSNEDDLFSLAPYLDERFMIVSARAPIMLQPMSYAWFNLGFTPQGIVVNPEEMESSRRTIHKFLCEIVEAYDCDTKAVYLMGFSQGAMMSLAVALTYPGSAAAGGGVRGGVLRRG